MSFTYQRDNTVSAEIGLCQIDARKKGRRLFTATPAISIHKTPYRIPTNKPFAAICNATEGNMTQTNDEVSSTAHSKPNS